MPNQGERSWWHNFRQRIVNAVRVLVDWVIRTLRRSNRLPRDPPTIVPQSPSSDDSNTQEVNPLLEGSPQSENYLTTDDLVTYNVSGSGTETANEASRISNIKKDSSEEKLETKGEENKSCSSHSDLPRDSETSDNKEEKNKSKQPEPELKLTPDDSLNDVEEDKDKNRTIANLKPISSYQPLPLSGESDVSDRSPIIEHFKKKSKGSIFLKETPAETPAYNTSKDQGETVQSQKPIGSGESEAHQKTSKSSSETISSHSSDSRQRYLYTSLEEEEAQPTIPRSATTIPHLTLPSKPQSDQTKTTPGPPSSLPGSKAPTDSSSSEDTRNPVIIQEQALVHRANEDEEDIGPNAVERADQLFCDNPPVGVELVPEILVKSPPLTSPDKSSSSASEEKEAGELQVKSKDSKLQLTSPESQNTYNDFPSDTLDQDTSEANSLSEDSIRSKDKSKLKQSLQTVEVSDSNPASSQNIPEATGTDTSTTLREETQVDRQETTQDKSDLKEIDNSATGENSVPLAKQETLDEIEDEEILEEDKVIKQVSEFEAASSKEILKSTGRENHKRITEEILTSTEDFKYTKINFTNTISITETFIVNEVNFENLTKGNKMPVKTSEAPKSAPRMNAHEIEQDPQIRVLTLNDQVFQESTLYRLEQNWNIEFRLGPTLFGRKIVLYCNFPEQENGKFEFVRSDYRSINWKRDEGCENSDDTSLYARIHCAIAGSFHYYFTYRERNEEKVGGSGYFLVDPIIRYGENEKLSLDCVQCQTVISKHLGSFSTWKNKLRVSRESGYNMIHFTPVQELGESNSAYSLKDQLQLNPAFMTANHEMPTWDELKAFIAKIRKDWKMASICDIVLNHTANETPWIQKHPEATYNCQNCTYMRPSYLLDAALNHFSMQIQQGMYETKGIPALINTEDHLNALRYHFVEGVLKELKIHELFTCDTNKYVSLFMDKARHTDPEKEPVVNTELTVIQDPEYRRLASKIDIDLALKIYNIFRPGCFDEDSRLRKCCEEFKQKLDALNGAIIEKLQDNLNAAVGNVVSGIRYWRVQQDGPRLDEITDQNPLVYRYFTDYGNPKSLKEYEDIMYSSNGKYLMAHNGWVLNGDPLVNFAGPQSDVYIRRELIAWGDSVKLRYGDKPADSPYLWDRMRKYVEQTADIFDGVRLDNCHSTPIHVAEYLLDCARKIRPDLYVVAELFTNSDEKDNIFVNKLGISSLIREALNAWDSHEQGRLVHRFGGVPVGAFYQPNIRPLMPSIAHALFLDLTHDNPSPVEKRSVFDLLPSSALVNMACCGTGSNRGYDELVPHHISVVEETREYTEWTSQISDDNPKYVTKESGIIAVKRVLNDLHYKLGSEGFNQVYVDQMDPDIVAVTRHCPKTHQSYILVAFTAFNHPDINSHKFQRDIKPFTVEGVLDEIVLEATLSHVGFLTGDSKYSRPENFTKDTKHINGFSEYKVQIKEKITLAESGVFEEFSTGKSSEIVLKFKNFKPGSVVILKVSLPKTAAEAVKDVRSLMAQFSRTRETVLKTIIKKMNLSDLNRALYRCDQEERDEGNNFDTYNIPNYGHLVYAGFQGFLSLLSKIRPNNDLGHPMCDNLRQGNWMIDYISQRLKLDEGTAELGVWFEENTRMLKALPRYMKPAYFDLIVTGVYILLMEQSHKSISSFVNKGSVFVRALSMGSLQFAAYIKSADLPVLSPNLALPKPPFRLDANGKEFQACVSLSAGLPHFSVGYMRNWGRDTFIAMRGLFILTGRYEDARYHILAYGACLRHGLIPNLLDGGRNSRFNCRDAVWWWLYCIKCYTEEVPNGIKILQDKISRIFPNDDSPPQPPGTVDQTLEDVIQEALTKHFQGLRFRERNAGRQIDDKMTDNGFNNQIGVHPETGFVFGGNVDNCGTWMDKMGSSAVNIGKPATPRDGSACEIVGLSKSVISWLAHLYEQKKYKYDGVQRTHSNGNSTKWSFKSWSEKIQNNFEKFFWVSDKAIENEIRPDLINKRGIYKDCYGATQEWTDFQLRCNFPIVMVVAPELFNPQRAWIALQQAEKYLLGPLGMKTLDPGDWAYRGDYDNSNDSGDASIAQGFNYHQGPEWVWPIGYFLRAKLYFAAKNNKLQETIAEIKQKLSVHFTELQTSDWRGLPELTNSNGSYCKDSSRTQAWSMSSILEVLYDLQKFESSV